MSVTLPLLCELGTSLSHAMMKSPSASIPTHALYWSYLSGSAVNGLSGSSGFTRNSGLGSLIVVAWKAVAADTNTLPTSSTTLETTIVGTSVRAESPVNSILNVRRPSGLSAVFKEVTETVGIAVRMTFTPSLSGAEVFVVAWKRLAYSTWNASSMEWAVSDGSSGEMTNVMVNGSNTVDTDADAKLPPPKAWSTTTNRS